MTNENVEKAVEMPSFNLNELSFSSDADIDAALETSKRKDRTMFDPGQYDVEISEATFAGMAENDKSWGKVYLTLKAGTRTIKDTILVPYRDIKYGKDGTMLPFKKLKNFVGSLGHELKIENLNETLKTVFSKPETLVGRHVKTSIGYSKGYVRYVKPVEGAQATYEIVQRDGNIITDVSGQALRFPSRDAAEAHAKSKNVAIDKYCNVTSYDQSTQDKGAAKLAGW